MTVRLAASPPSSNRRSASCETQSLGRSPLVSVVVPAYNEEKYLGACLDALLRQEHPAFAFEVIVVDDGSTDGTRELALSRNVRVISQPNRGVSKARQAGFEAACGEIVASTDADTVCPPQWLNRIVAHFRADPSLVGVFGPARLLDGSGSANALVCYGGIIANRLHCALGKPAFGGFNFAVSRKAWQLAGGFNTGWHSAEDVSLSLKLKDFGVVRFDVRLMVATSARRLRLGWLSAARQYGSNYFRVFWLHSPGLPFENIR